MITTEALKGIHRLRKIEWELQNLYEENGGEITAETQALEEEKAIIFDVLDNDGGVDALGRWLKSVEDEEKALKDEAAAIAAKRKRNAQKQDFIKGVISEYLKFRGEDKVRGSVYSFSSYTSSTCKANDDAIRDVYQHYSEDILKKAGVPEFVKVSVSGNVTAAKAMEEFPDEFFDITSKDTVKFSKPRRTE